MQAPPPYTHGPLPPPPTSVQLPTNRWPNAKRLTCNELKADPDNKKLEAEPPLARWQG